MPYVEFHRWILAAVLAMVRIGGAFAICPALTDSMIPGVARRAAVLGMAIFIVPSVMQGMPPGEPNYWMFSLVALKEAILGFLIGFFAAVPFWIAENVGNFIDNQRGATMGEVYSPLSGAQVSTTGIFLTQMVSTIFFVGGGMLVFLAAVYKSFDIVPMFGGWAGLAPGAPAFALETLDGMMEAMFVISAPIVILMFLATVGLGFVNRTAPQLNVFFLSMPVKSALGVAMLVVYLQYILDMLMYDGDGAILGPLRRILA